MKNDLMKLCLLILSASALLLSSCKKDKVEENAQEVVTTVQLTLVPQGGGATARYKFDDPDGPGGGSPTTDDIILVPNKTYNVTVQLLNKTVTPEEDLTIEVAAEAQAHRFYYQASNGSNVTVSGLNNDGAGVPLGLTSIWTTGATARGTIKITLRHYPGNPPGKAVDDPVDSSKSSTDVQVNFNTRIE